MFESMLVAVVALGASMLTFVSGFGLGTLLLPVFAWFFPVPAALMMTAVVHLLNNLVKLALLGPHIRYAVVLRFGLAAMVFAWLGSKLLVHLAVASPLASYQWLGNSYQVTTVGLIVGALMILFAVVESLTSDRHGFAPRWLPLGGALSGFFGGLSGHQGALRAAFLVRCKLGREGFIATGVAIACLVDLARLSQYLPNWRLLSGDGSPRLLLLAIAAAFTGAIAGRRLLTRISLHGVQHLVASLLLLTGIAMAAGLI